MLSEYRNPKMITRTWHVWRTQATEIAALGDELGISHNALVRRILEIGLREIRTGRIQLHTRPVRWELLDDE